MGKHLGKAYKKIGRVRKWEGGGGDELNSSRQYVFFLGNHLWNMLNSNGFVF